MNNLKTNSKQFKSIWSLLRLVKTITGPSQNLNVLQVSVGLATYEW